MHTKVLVLCIGLKIKNIQLVVVLFFLFVALSSIYIYIFFLYNEMCVNIMIIIIMYIYHALINALSAHMIHINLNMIFYTHVKHSPTKTIYIKYYREKKTWCLTSTETIRLIRDGGKGVWTVWEERGGGGGGGGYVCVYIGASVLSSTKIRLVS